MTDDDGNPLFDETALEYAEAEHLRIEAQEMAAANAAAEDNQIRTAALEQQIQQLQISANEANEAIRAAEAMTDAIETNEPQTFAEAADELIRQRYIAAEAALTRQLQDSVTQFTVPTAPAAPGNRFTAASAAFFDAQHQYNQLASDVWRGIDVAQWSGQTVLSNTAVTQDSIAALDRDLYTWQRRIQGNPIQTEPAKAPYDNPTNEQEHLINQAFRQGQKQGHAEGVHRGREDQKAWEEANSRMTRKHFILLARIIGELNVSKGQREQIAQKFALRLRGQGSAFDSEKFLKEIEKIAVEDQPAPGPVGFEDVPF